MQKIHFIAIGGAAMHNLALAMAAMPDYQITGSDDEIFDPARTHLAEHGLLPNDFGWHPERITPDLDAVILGMHARKDNPELLRAQELGIRIYSFPEFLYEQSRNKIRVVVGGSHGKTTTTSMILYVLQQLGIEADYMVGAQIEGFERMVRISPTAKIAVFEGDEYLTSPLDLRSKFHWYHPHIAILTGIAWDHINVFPTFPQYVETFRQFTELMEPNAKLIYCQDDAELCTIAANKRSDLQAIPYGTPEHQVVNGKTCILSEGEEIGLQVFGKHNLQNMNAARIVCRQLGISDHDFYHAIASFTGASNRLEKVLENDEMVVFKDFAHSPSKLKATVNAVREQYPDKRVVACMELHTFSSLTAAFLPQYKDCMKEADTAYVYFNPHVIEHKRLEPITADAVQKAFGTSNVHVFTDSTALQSTLRELDYHHTALLMMSSGTFDGIQVKSFAEELASHLAK